MDRFAPARRRSLAEVKSETACAGFPRRLSRPLRMGLRDHAEAGTNRLRRLVEQSVDLYGRDAVPRDGLERRAEGRVGTASAGGRFTNAGEFFRAGCVRA